MGAGGQRGAQGVGYVGQVSDFGFHVTSLTAAPA
jgi:hypothetical protein